jgi:hypothetical protein
MLYSYTCPGPPHNFLTKILTALVSDDAISSDSESELAEGSVGAHVNNTSNATGSQDHIHGLLVVSILPMELSMD